MAAAIQGAVLTKNTGVEFQYRYKCESCGWVESSTLGGYEPVGGGYLSTVFWCPKCKNRQEVRIEYTRQS
jgi:predicted RNA-binding Zn-ribbon protein involved in translation (DUF1610 family)